MQTFPGIDRCTFFETPLFPITASTGVWALPLEAQGGDKRSAANLMAGIEANRNAINFLGWRTVNWPDGGVYTWTNPIALANAMSWNGLNTFRQGATINNAGSFTCSRP